MAYSRHYCRDYKETTLLDRLLHNSAMSKDLILKKLYITFFVVITTKAILLNGASLVGPEMALY